jgi:DNA-binding NtrC family response regulator
MSVAIFSSPTIPLSEVVMLLEREDIAVSDYSLELEKDDLQISEGVQKIILIFEDHGVAEDIEKIKNISGGHRKLILCCPHQSNANYELLVNLGVDDFITPKTWSSYHIAERILGHLIIEGEIQPTNLGRLYGATRVMRNLYEEINTIAELSDPVLILGETGTGKDVVAGEIHRLSKRDGKYIALNCSEFSYDIIESELFGHAKGSFTGAGNERKGLLLESGAGTVFLDEIGELPMPLQSKLLRVIEDKKIRPVGSNNWLDIKCRFVLATNRNIEKEIEAKHFRQDLFERISGFTIQLPALREKMADVILLFNLFLEEYCNEYNKIVYTTPNSLDQLFNYSWKGNIRELRALVRNLAAHSVAAENKFFISPLRITETISQRTIKEDKGRSISFDPATETLEKVLLRVETRYLRELLELTGSNRERAIELSGISKSTFYDKIKKATNRFD